MTMGPPDRIPEKFRPGIEKIRQDVPGRSVGIPDHHFGGSGVEGTQTPQRSPPKT